MLILFYLRDKKNIIYSILILTIIILTTSFSLYISYYDYTSEITLNNNIYNRTLEVTNDDNLLDIIKNDERIVDYNEVYNSVSINYKNKDYLLNSINTTLEAEQTNLSSNEIKISLSFSVKNKINKNDTIKIKIFKKEYEFKVIEIINNKTNDIYIQDELFTKINQENEMTPSSYNIILDTYKNINPVAEELDNKNYDVTIGLQTEIDIVEESINTTKIYFYICIIILILLYLLIIKNLFLNEQYNNKILLYLGYKEILIKLIMIIRIILNIIISLIIITIIYYFIYLILNESNSLKLFIQNNNLLNSFKINLNYLIVTIIYLLLNKIEK